jgi:hypothetical protein
MMHWRDYTGKEVVVHSQGTTYRGRMVEMTDDAILLRADTGHCEIMMATVTGIELAGDSGSTTLSPSPLAPSPLAKFTDGGDKK